MARNRDLSPLAIVGVIIGVILLLVALGAFSAWIIMLVWGGLASTFGFQTIGFGTAWLVGIGLSIVGSYFKRPVSAKS